MPIANIKQRIFSVWFKFGVTKIAKDSTAAIDQELPKASRSENVTDKQSAADEESKTTSKLSRPIPKKKNYAQDKADLDEYRVSPKTKTLAEIALVKYPIGLAVTIFAIIDGIIIALAIYLRKRMKGKADHEN